MPRFKDQAICIRLIDWSEASQIVALLCEQHGKLRGLAKGSKRTSPSAVARYSGGIELLTMGQIVGITKPTTELATLTEWDLQAPYWHLRHSLRAQRLGLYGADLASAFLADHDPHPKVFAALTQFLDQLANPREHDRALLVYQWRVLEDCGYRPQLEHDVRTGRPLTLLSDVQPPTDQGAHQAQDAYGFDPQAGGLTHGSSLTGRPLWRVRPTTITLLAKLTVDPTHATTQADPQTIRRANRLLCMYARAILDRQLPTMGPVLEPGP